MHCVLQLCSRQSVLKVRLHPETSVFVHIDCVFQIAVDWKKRRDDFHFKEKRLKALYEKARNRNPDEFYHAMTSSKTKVLYLLLTYKSAAWNSCF